MSALDEALRLAADAARTVADEKTDIDFQLAALHVEIERLYAIEQRAHAVLARETPRGASLVTLHMADGHKAAAREILGRAV